MAEIESKIPQTLIAIVPTPGMGHLFPLIELAKRLVVHYRLAITFIVPNDGSSMELQKKLLDSLPSPISYIFLPPVGFDDLPEDATIEARIELSLVRSLPALKASLEGIMAESSTHLAALVTDVFGPSSFDVACELGVSPYIFFPTTAMVLSFFFRLPSLDATTSCEYRLLPDPIEVPGCVPVHGRDLFNPLHDRKSETYAAFVEMTKRYRLASGIMVNTFVDLEPGPIKALNSGVHQNPPIYPIGPLTQSVDLKEKSTKHECLTWLDDQPKGSVMFVSFGSGGTLSTEQLTELAHGLEASGQRFLWVVKSPNDKSSEAAFFIHKSRENPFHYLPKGFLERTRGSGLVVESWAPQVEVLAHGSTGGFLTHCGWNSTLESIMHGVPLIAWPLYAEQRMNAVFLSDSVGVALRVEGDERGIVGRQEIAEKGIKLMKGDEGKAMRNKMNELNQAAKMALATDGSSTNSLDEVVQIWKSYNNN